MTTPPSPNVLPSSTRFIPSEADVLAFFAAASERLAKLTGIEYAVVELTYRDGKPDWCAYVDGGQYVHGATCDEAIAAEEMGMSPRARAARLRRQADAIDASVGHEPPCDIPWDTDAPPPPLAG